MCPEETEETEETEQMLPSHIPGLVIAYLAALGTCHVLLFL